jgi:hypothetical protein
MHWYHSGQTLGIPSDRSSQLGDQNNSPSINMSCAGSSLPPKEFLTRRRIGAINEAGTCHMVRSKTYIVSRSPQNSSNSLMENNETFSAQSFYSYPTDQLSDSIFTETLEANECCYRSSDWDVEAQKYNEETTKLAKEYFIARNNPSKRLEIEKKYELLNSNVKKN